MVSLKCITIMIILMTITANAEFNYIKAINDVVSVQKSNTCVILVIDGAIQFVATERRALKELEENYGNIASNKNLEVRETFRPLSATDIVQKLSEIGSTRSTFLVYFNATPQPRDPPQPHPHRPHVENKNSVGGILGAAQKALGIEVADKGLIPLQLDIFG